jgi:hypothetical protein
VVYDEDGIGAMHWLCHANDGARRERIVKATFKTMMPAINIDDVLYQGVLTEETKNCHERVAGRCSFEC